MSPTTATTTGTLADHADRFRIATSHHETLFVEAGAGSGKTASLVGRLVTLVVGNPGGGGDGTPADIESIAAITFTEAAAAELRARVRQSLEDVAAGRPVRDVTDAPSVRAAAHTALTRLDRATICTLHAFAQRLLLAAPVESGLPPRVEVHDDVSSSLRFEDRWRRFERRMLDDADLEVTMRTALTLGIDSRQLEVLAAVLGQNWDLVEEAGLAGHVARARAVDVDPSTLPVEGWINRLAELLGLLDRCTNEQDTLVVWVREQFEPLLDALVRNRTDPYRALAVLAGHDGTKSVGNRGNKQFWAPEDKATTIGVCNELKTELADAIAELTDRVLTRLGGELSAYTLADAVARRREGRLEFHDLLVLARSVLRTDRSVRARFHQRYQRLLIDEFQDTDPLQIELAVRIAADPDHDPATPWHEVDVAPGRLFFVGDPKQSIYRFRRADIDLFARTRLRHHDGYTSLRVNFRTVPPVLRFCNALFAHLIVPSTDTDEPGGRIAQPDYVPLLDVRSAMPPDRCGPPVVLLGDGTPHASADDARRAEADDVAAVLRRANDDGWAVEDGGALRACRWSDMAVLLPSRTTMPRLRDALDASDIPYRIESGTLVYGTTEVTDLLAVLHAVDDPGDTIALAGALRSSAYGCGDDDLAGWVRAAGGLSTTNIPPDAGPSPVADALEDIRARYRRAPFQTVPEIVDGVIRDRRLLDLCLVGDRHRDAWRLYRVVLEDARQFADADPGGLRAFLRSAALQRDDKLRAASPVIPEADVDAVRIMTVHASKGLEFPITAVSGLSAQDPNGRRGATVLFHPAGGFDIRMRRGMETTRFESVRTLEETMDEHERIRLLYVALTRARDHLIVSTHHTASAQGRSHGGRISTALASIESPVGALAERFTTARTDDGPTGDGGPALGPPAGALPGVLPGAGTVEPLGAPSAADRGPWDERIARWHDDRRGLVAASRTGGVVSATALARHLAADPDAADPDDADPDDADPDDGDPDDGGDGLWPPDEGSVDPADRRDEPWRRGRTGTAVGRAVHAVLEQVDLAAPDDVDALAAWHARAEGIPDAASEIAAKAASALASPLFARAVAASRRWREVHVSSPIAGIVDVADEATHDLFEGFVDLLFEEDGALVVVDLKTDAVRDDAAVTAALRRYTPQGAAYAVALEAAVGLPVAEVHFLFLGRDRAVDAVVVDLPAATARVRAALGELAAPQRTARSGRHAGPDGTVRERMPR